MKKMITAFVLGASILSAGYTFAADPNPIAIKYKGKDGKDIIYYRSDVLEAKRNFPIEEIRKAPDDAVFDKVRDQILIDLLLAEEIEAANLQNDDEVKEAKIELVKQAEKAAQQKVWFKREIDEKVKEEVLLEKYRKLEDNLKGKKMYSLAIIVVDKGKSGEVLKQAMAGHDFGALAKKYSMEPTTRERGGELGFLHEVEVEQALGKDVAKRLKVLKDGACSNRVIEKGGKHFILKRLASKKAQSPKFEEVLPQLRALVQQEVMAAMIERMKKRKEKNIEVNDFTGKKCTPLKASSRSPIRA